MNLDCANYAFVTCRTVRPSDLWRLSLSEPRLGCCSTPAHSQWKFPDPPMNFRMQFPGGPPAAVRPPLLLPRRFLGYPPGPPSAQASGFSEHHMQADQHLQRSRPSLTRKPTRHTCPAQTAAERTRRGHLQPSQYWPVLWAWDIRHV